jgi:phosphoglucomutase
MTPKQNLEKWLAYNKLDASLRKELVETAGNETEINERFSAPLAFGTGGLRGIIRAGTNGMNIYTVRQATQGLANLINKNERGTDILQSAAIAYDSRLYSDVFAREAAAVLAANGIKAYIFPELRPTPMLSFAVRYLNATAGIVITASHNPAKYNGYKAYWSDGGQLPPEEADVVYAEMKKVDIFDGVKTLDFEDGISSGIIEYIKPELDGEYYNAVTALSINPETIKNSGLKVVYTPFHGAGNIPVRTVLQRMGLGNLTVVKEQELPDPAFLTVKSPNPEEAEGFKYALKYAVENDADIIIGTDPDSDRVGLLLKNSEGKYDILNGNQIGIILVTYILQGLSGRSQSENGKIPANGAVIKTIVTTGMVNEIAKDYGISVINVLTGFKFIGEKIKRFEQTGEHTYLFGFEESYGYLSGTHARDKDAVNACLLICEAAAYYKLRNETLKEVLGGLYEKYGYYTENLVSVTHEGLSGLEKIKQMMVDLRQNLPEEFAGVKTVTANDYLSSISTCLKTKEKTALPFPKSDVLSFLLEDGTLLTVRPSGTEPKIKAYVMTKGKTAGEAEANKEKYTAAIKALLN